MASEIELKLALPEDAQRALLRHPLLRAALDKRSERLANIYFDTPDLKLRRRGMALRLRRQGDRWLQTVKCAGEQQGGLSIRPEWETAYGNRFDFAAIDDARVRAFLEKPAIRDRLLPIFETDFRRTTWRFPGLALMLDRGWVAAAGRRQPISEVELELTGGAAADLFVLAEQLAARLPLAPAVLSKAERGYQLFLDTPPTPARAGRSTLTVEHFDRLAPLAAFGHIAADCLDHLQRNHQGALTSDDPEYIHQMRVATRRLRAAMRLFAPLLPEGFAVALGDPLAALMDDLGQARDLDVLLQEIKAPVLEAHPDDPRLAALARIVLARRDAARETARARLASPAYGQLLLRFLGLLQQPPFTAAGGDGSLARFSADRLQRLRRRVRRLARAAEIDDAESLHAVRIAVKRLRYALEFFVAHAEGKRRARLAARLAEAQGSLGQLNDLSNAERLLNEAAAGDSDLQAAIALVHRWHERRRLRLLEHLGDVLGGLRRLPEVG